MVRKLFALVLVLGLCIVPVGRAEDWNEKQGTMLVSSCWAYAEPSPAAQALQQLHMGLNYEIHEIKNGWSKVQLTDGSFGWVPETAIDYVDALPPEIDVSNLRRAVVICEGLSLRELPKASEKRLALMPNGSHGYILGEQDGWLQLRYLHREKNQPPEVCVGWVQKEYTVENPLYIHLKQRTNVLAFDSQEAPVVGQTSANARLAVIGNVGDYYVVNLRSASGFVHKAEQAWTEYDVIHGE